MFRIGRGRTGPDCSSSPIVPRVSFLSETAVRRTDAVLVIPGPLLTDVARLPVVGFTAHVRLDVLLFLLLFALPLNRKGVIEIVLRFRVVWLSFVGIKAFPDLFGFALFRVGVAV